MAEKVLCGLEPELAPHFRRKLVPDLVRWEEYSGKKTLSGKMGRDTSISLVESVRQDRAKRLTIFDQQYVTVRHGERRRHQFTLTFRTLSIREMSSRLEHRRGQSRR